MDKYIQTIQAHVEQGLAGLPQLSTIAYDVFASPWFHAIILLNTLVTANGLKWGTLLSLPGFAWLSYIHTVQTRSFDELSSLETSSVALLFAYVGTLSVTKETAKRIAVIVNALKARKKSKQAMLAYIDTEKPLLSDFLVSFVGADPAEMFDVLEIASLDETKRLSIDRQ